MRRCIFALIALSLLLVAVPTPAQLAEANDAAGILVMERLKGRDARGHALLSLCPPRRILLVDGIHDHTDRVLRTLGIPFERCSPRELPRRSLRGVRLLILDCPGDIGEGDIERTRRFVIEGGTLLSTDWTLDRVLERAFPGKVSFNRRPTNDDVVRIDRVSARDPLLRWVFPHGRRAAWWLENQSHPIQVLGRDVRVLLASSEMERRYGEPAIAVTFGHGRGRVVHVVSHTYLQRNVHVRPWESRSAAAEAPALDLPVESEGYRKLEREGVLGRVRAGDINAAVSAQQLLVNVLLAALGDSEALAPPVEVPATPDPVPPAGRPWVRAARATRLHDTPAGEWTLRVGAGLRLRVLESREGWSRVATPAGQEGWVPTSDLAP